MLAVKGRYAKAVTAAFQNDPIGGFKIYDLAVMPTKKLIELIHLEPSPETIEVLVLDTAIFAEGNTLEIKDIIKTKHKDVCVVILTSGDATENVEDLLTLPNVTVERVGGISDRDAIRSVVKNAIRASKNASNQTIEEVVTSAVITPIGSDDVNLESPVQPDNIEEYINRSEYASPIGSFSSEFIPGGMTSRETAGTIDSELQNIPPVVNDPNRPAPEDKINLTSKTMSMLDTALIDGKSHVVKEALSTHHISKELADTNAEYPVIVHQLMELVNRMGQIATYNNGSEAMSKLYATAEQYRTLLSQSNNFLVKYLLQMLDYLTISFKEADVERVNEFDKRIATTTTRTAMKCNDEELSELISERHAIVNELTEYRSQILKLSQGIEASAVSVTEHLTNPPYTTGHLIGSLYDNNFQPFNTAELIKVVISATQDKVITLSEADAKISKLSKLVDSKDAIDTMIIDKQGVGLALMRARHLEGAVVIKNEVQSRTTVHVGIEGSGHTVTAVCIAEAQARSASSILIDLSHTSNLGIYIRESMTLTDAYNAVPIEAPCYIQRTNTCELDLDAVWDLMTTAAPHYRYINILIGADDIDVLKYFTDRVLVINYITGGNALSLKKTKEIMDLYDGENTALQVTKIASNLDWNKFLGALGKTSVEVQVKEVPLMSQIQSATILNKNPGMDEDVLDLFRREFI